MSIKVKLKRQHFPKDRIGGKGQRKVFLEEQIQFIKCFLYSREDLRSIRDLALFSFALDTMLRSVDLLKLRVSDLVDGDGNLREVIEITQQKTGKKTLVEISRRTAKSVARWIEESDKGIDDFIFTGFTRNKKRSLPLCRMQYGRIIKGWVKNILQLDPTEYNTHSLRRTKAALIYDRTNNIEVVRQLLGHSSLAATSAYLNIGKKDALKIAKQSLTI